MYTMEDFKTKKIAFVPKNKEEMGKFLRACQECDLLWNHGNKPLEFMPDKIVYGALSLQVADYKENDRLCFADHYESAVRCGYQIIPASDFDFMQPSASPAPRYSIHITSDGPVTHCIYKIGDKVVKRTKATCLPPDVYSFLDGAERAFDKLAPKKKAQAAAAAPEYDEVSRPAQVGEKIKIVNPIIACGLYEEGEIFTVDNLEGCNAGNVHVKNAKILADARYSQPHGFLIIKQEYVVLVPRHGTR